MIRFVCAAFMMLIHGFAMGQDKNPPSVPYELTCTYELTYIPGSTSQATKTELFLLFMNQEESLFESKNTYLRDSAILAAENSRNRQNLMQFLQNHLTDFDFHVFKRGCNEIRTMDRFYRDYYTYAEAPNHLQWALTEDTAMISGYRVQRATTAFGGRKWSAWFTEAIPMSEGPYKFCGLPGLIVRITDSKKQYRFELTGLKQLRIGVPDQRDKSQKIEKARYFKKRQEYRANPIGVAEQSGVVFTSGRSEINQRVQQKIKSDNNPIEFFRN